ncbi:TolC family protein [Thiohalorhabdus denitrificans]|uniref:Outer membrane protein TolC n=1 Tax=Thiohalorhabdus denitrificans TaxID=381306 RepID=A0A1G5AUJ5_9GAMM|nr:TolC family protein [Thiohalorhabdus denitrificans]SCX81585.1 Outer membrane protein TolC [Thiohalorhabdus denitrificans]
MKRGARLRGSAALVLASLAVLPNWGWAERPAALPQGPLDLDQAVRIGLENHPSLMAAQARTKEREAQVRSATAGYRPRLYAEGILRQGRQIGGEDEGRFTDDSEARIVLEQDLYDFGAREAAGRAARFEREAAELELFDAQQRRVLAIRRQFYDTLLADRQVQVWNEAMAVAFIRWDYGQGREELGEISPVELARLESRFRDFRSKYRGAQYDARLARVRLAHAMGLEDAMPRDLVRPDLDLDRELPSVQELRNRAWRTNPRLIAARQRLDAARARTERRKAQRLPRVVGEVGAQRYSRQFDFRNDVEAAIRVEAPLYEGGRLGARVEAARAAAQQERASWLELRQQVEENIYDAHLDVQSWQERRAYAEALVRHRELKTDLARTEYVLELETDLGDSLTEQTRAEMKLAEAKFGLAMAYDRLDALVGEPLASKTEKRQ